MLDREIFGFVNDATSKFIDAIYAAHERAIRDYLKSHRTTRLDIEVFRPPLSYRTDGNLFVAGRDSYMVSIDAPISIIQRLPESFRPNLP